MNVYPVLEVPIGRLAIATRPRGDDGLERDLALFRREKWNVLVSALERHEEEELGLAQERVFAEALGIQYVRFPIRDRGTPHFTETLELASRLRALLEQDRSVAVHCRMGIGRSSLLCSAVLVTFGMDPDTIWKDLAKARGFQVPDTEEQYAWLRGFRDEWTLRGRRVQ